MSLRVQTANSPWHSQLTRSYVLGLPVPGAGDEEFTVEFWPALAACSLFLACLVCRSCRGFPMPKP